MDAELKTPNSWIETLKLYKHPRAITLFFLGFSAGLPLLLVFSTLSAWLTDYDVSRTQIGFFAWIGITYSIKVLWSPIVDRLPFWQLTQRFGQRRGWMLAGQLGVFISLLALSLLSPDQHLMAIAIISVIVAFSSATQDIAIDAYRIESAPSRLQGALAATYIFGYRVALLISGAGALFIADISSWSISYLCMALCMGLGVITVLIIDEPKRITEQSNQIILSTKNIVPWFRSAIKGPFVDFFKRNGTKMAIIILAFVGAFRISDIIMGIMANPFYLDLGFTKTDIASISKVFGFFMLMLGTALGGLLVARFGIMRSLLVGAIMVAATNLLFAVLATIGPNKIALAIVISADNLSGGIATTVFIAYLSSLTNTMYTATQYALFSSFMTLPGKFISGFSGVVVDAQGYIFFFSYAALLGLPAILLTVYMIKTLNKKPEVMSREAIS